MKSLDLKLIPLLMIIFAILIRLLPHPANVAPIAAMALFSGVYFPKKYALLFPIIALFISDLYLGFYGTTMYFVYGSFLITGIIGIWLKNHKGVFVIGGATLFSSILFYLITNFGVWLEPNSWYPKDFAGLLQSYVMALPFFRNTILGDLFFAGVFFGGYELALRFGKKYLPQKLFRLTF